MSKMKYVWAAALVALCVSMASAALAVDAPPMAEYRLAGAAPDPTGPYQGYFSDVPSGFWAWSWIEALKDAGKVQGYPDGTYRPDVQVTRDQMAVYMVRALELPTSPWRELFSDVPETQWAAPWIISLVDAGLVQGYPDGTYRPSVVVNRDAMAVYVARGMYGGMNVPTGPETPSFSDVPTGYWAYDEIEYCKGQGVVGGYPDGTYRPTEAVNRAQMAVYIWRGFALLW